MARYKKGEWSGAYQKILILAETGMAQHRIAKQVGLSRSHVCRIMKQEKFTKRQAAYEEKANAEIYEKFAAVSGDAADKIISVMRRGSAKDRIKLDAAKDILNYAGHKPKEHIENVTNNYTIEDANSAKKVIEEIRGLQDRLSIDTSKFLLSDTADTEKTTSNLVNQDTNSQDTSNVDSDVDSDATSENVTDPGEVVEGTIPSSPSR